MASKCHHCSQMGSPVYIKETGRFLDMVLCRKCYETEWALKPPHNYREVFKQMNVEWVGDNIHPEMPLAFRNTDMEFNDFMRKVKAWAPVEGKCGVIMHGQTGLGKSRAAWWLYNKLWMDNHTDSMFLQMRKFEAKIAEGFDEKKHSKVIDALISAKVVVLDDLGKERLTPRLETDLFAVMDERTSGLKTTIITTNYTGDTLVDRFNSRETGVAFVRRLRDYFVGIST